VHSLYFDRGDERARRDTAEGADPRSKLRLRWYGDAVLGVRARFEHKERRGELVFKRGVELAQPLDVDGAAAASLVASVRARVPDEWRSLLARDERPAQWIAYEREYLRTASGRVRVTIDRGLEAWEQRFAPVVARRVRTLLPSVVIVELKAAPGDADELRELLDALEHRPAKCSKFLLAADAHALAAEIEAL
jgi:hypothetical protein